MIKKLIKKNFAIIAFVLFVICSVLAGCIFNYIEKKKDNVVLNKVETTEVETDDIEEENEKKEEAPKEEVKTEEAVNNEVNKTPQVQEQPKKTEEPKEKKQEVEKPKSSTAGKVTTYTSKKFGIQLTFPAGWHNKYEVCELEDGIFVKYIFQHNYHYNSDGQKVNRTSKALYLFCIRDAEKLSQNEIDVIDGIRNVPKNKTIHGKKYVIGGPTDWIGNDDPDVEEIMQFKNDIAGIINNLKEV